MGEGGDHRVDELAEKRKWEFGRRENWFETISRFAGTGPEDENKVLEGRFDIGGEGSLQDPYLGGAVARIVQEQGHRKADLGGKP